MSLATVWRRRLSLLLLRGSGAFWAVGKLVVAKALREAAQVQSLATRLIGKLHPPMLKSKHNGFPRPVQGTPPSSAAGMRTLEDPVPLPLPFLPLRPSVR